MGVGHRSAGRIRLGELHYDVATGSLSTPSGEEFLLRWQSTQVLQLLVQHMGKLVSRDDLITEIWRDVAVTDDSLTQCIADIRRALGDGERRILRTLPKRGYILEGERDTAPATLDTTQSVADFFAEDRQSYDDADPAQRISANLDCRDIMPTIVVLPLQVQAQDSDDMLGVFIADEIIAGLCRSHDLSIISRLSTLSLESRIKSSTEMRKQFDADFVVSGSAYLADAHIYMNIEFAESVGSRVLWADRLRIQSDDLMQSGDWVEQIVSQIRTAIMVREVARIQTTPFEKLDLYSYLHGAVGLMHRLSKRDFNKARTLLVQLAELVPHHPAPKAWIARWHVLCAMQGWSSSAKDNATLAVDFAKEALELDPNNTLALTSLGFVKTNLLGELDEAQSYYDAAIATNPNDAQARALRGMAMAFADQAKQGLRDAERALHLTPKDPHRFFYLVLAAGANLSAGDYERAVLLATESRRLNRTHISTLRTLAAAQAGAGQLDAAHRTVRELMRLQPDLNVRGWLSSSPSKGFEIGERFAGLLRRAGVPN